MQRNDNVQPTTSHEAIVIPMTEIDVPSAQHHVHGTDHVYHTMLATITDRDAERQAIEDTRAIRRNRNRFATLLLALVLGFIIPTILPWFGPMGVSLLKYSFSITIMLDAGLAAYAYVKRY